MGSQRGLELSIAIGFGFVASLLYFVAGFTGHDHRLGLWYLLYRLSWPISWAVIQVIARLEGFLPDWLFGRLYVSGVFMAAMLWLLLIALTIRYVATKLKPR